MKNTRSNFVKESLLDYENLAKTLKENTSSAVKDLLSETVRETYNRILSEEDENEYDEEEVEDTDSENENDANVDSDKSVKKETDEVGDMESELDGETPIEGEEEVGNEEEVPMEAPTSEEEPSDEGSEDEGWAEFDKYKVSDDEYDFSQAEDEEIVKVYKLLKDDDQVLVNVDKDSNKVELKDNSTGAEYLLDLSSLGGGSSEEPLMDDTNDMDAEGDLDYNEDMTNESRIFEIALNEYDSHVGYTDNYQSKDVMTNPGMSEPGKNVNDWDAGVPKGTKKPWASKGSDKPFDKKGATTVESVEGEDVVTENEETLEEQDSFVRRNSTTKTGPNMGDKTAYDASTEGRNASNTPKAAKIKGTPNPRYSNGTNESKMMAKAEKILKENKALKNALNQFRTVLQEAAVTNKNLGQIIKLISENSTTKAEKQEIIARFGKEANSIEASDKLYESISNELKKSNTMNINEDKQFTTNGSQMINETQIYQSKDLIDSLDLMHRICK